MPLDASPRRSWAGSSYSPPRPWRSALDWRSGTPPTYHPRQAPIVRGFDARHAVAHAGRRATGPEVRGFGDMGIDVDDRVAAHIVPPLAVLPGAVVCGSARLLRVPCSAIPQSARI